MPASVHLILVFKHFRVRHGYLKHLKMLIINKRSPLTHGFFEVYFFMLRYTDLAPWKENYDKPRQHIKKQRHYFPNKGP